MSEKKQIRKRLEEQRALLPEALRMQYSQQICGRMANFISELRSDSDLQTLKIFVYIPFRDEIQLMPFIERCWQSGAIVYAPRVNKAAHMLELYLIESEADLECGTWGIKEPRTTLPQLPIGSWPELDIIVVPGIAFDEQGGRIGYGGGFYDRFMEEMDNSLGIQDHSEAQTKKPLIVALSYQFQVLEQVPMEPHDFRVDVLITENSLIYTRQLL